MISQKDLQALQDYIHETLSGKVDTVQADYLMSVVETEKTNTAPGNEFWNYMGMWTSADLYHYQFPAELIKEFEDEIDGGWLDHIAIEAEERWGEDWTDCIEEVINIIDEDHADLGDKLQEIVDYLDTL